MNQIPTIIPALIDRFEQNRESYKSQSYNETQLRREFLDPFFEALGWDVANKQGHAEAYKDVIHEDAIKIGGNTKAPDYCFRIGGARKFFLEAKKPSINLKDEPAPAYQLRRYAWSAKLPLSILTDFEEFAVYDCRTRPNPSDKPSTGRILYLTYRDYLAKWDEIASIFTKEAVLKGSFDKYAVTDRKRGTATVDTEFLKEIETWREALAKNLAARNSTLSVHELNFAVQRTIDRLIFLRICEDRGVEPYGQLQALLNGQNIYSRLCYLYEQADDRYNSGLFHFHQEKGRAESPDNLTPRLKIDDKVLKDILGRLYYPQSPYEFSVFPTEILGQVYEQFLGKVIRLTAGHQAKVEEKPEVKKAGGVYYTPAYIVEYIVKHTVGALCEGPSTGSGQGKQPKQIAKLTILDPACGSGSFLIGAYRYLLNYHRDWYVNDGPEKHRKELFQAASGEWRLTTQEKKRILLNNIYGVDIDSQAVEVTKLSLLLKVLEGESDETLKRQLSFVKERALPDLGQNIKCGNSLIGPDYFAGQLMPDEDEMRRVNPFDWKAEFPHIFPSPSGRGRGEGAGGFDAVIGNPPYIRMESFKKLKAYLEAHYETHAERADIFFYFVEAAARLVRNSGLLGYILSNSFTRSEAGATLRRFISQNFCIKGLVEFGDFLPFNGATVYPIITILERADPMRNRGKVAFVLQDSEPVLGGEGFTITAELDESRFSGAAWVFEEDGICQLRERLLSSFSSLKSIFGDVNMGIKTGLNEAFIIDQETRNRIIASNKATAEIIKPYLGGRDLDRWRAEGEDLYLIYTPHGIAMKPYPAVLRHLDLFKSALTQRATRQEWYELQQPQEAYQQYFEAPKIIYPDMSRYPKFSLDCSGSYFSNTVYFIPSDSLFLLGLLNSKLLWFVIRGLSNALRGGLWRFRLFSGHVERLPIPKLNLSNKPEKVKHDKMISLVERMLDLHKRLSQMQTPTDKARLQRQINTTDQEIDRLVYGLYGLSEDEIKIVEAASVASPSKVKENDGYDESHASAGESHPSQRQVAPLAPAARRSGDTPGSVSGPGSGVGGGIDEIRERTGDYGPPPGAPGESQDNPPGSIGSTRYFDTAEGVKSYAEVAEHLAVSLTATLRRIVDADPSMLSVTSEWLCLRHRDLAGGLFPDWAGRFRDRDIQIGAHHPPPFYEVPVHMRLFCDDLAERLRHVQSGAPDFRVIAELLAVADGRFQSIHPFRDFNGRVGRMLLVALLHMLGLPPVEIVPAGPEFRQAYLEALDAADRGDYRRLTEMWLRRLADAL